MVAAVPFLRDFDLRTSQAAEEYDDKVQQIKKGIHQRFHQLGQHVSAYRTDGIPTIAMGHLFAGGSEAATEERNAAEKDIYVGNQGRVGVEVFPDEFMYIALGHLHRPHAVSKREHIRYSGSPIPLSFSERDDQKQVKIVSFRNGQLTDVEPLTVSLQRPFASLPWDT